ncbi:MAG TPA: hypothetical protein VGQ93_07615, partial [Lysobacter sp.]|nr:hypothetical protein [Lysobacter sp.]
KLDDLRQRALIAEYWHKHADHTCVDADLQTIEGPWVNPNDVDDWGERAVAHLIHAALGFAEG